MLFLAWESLLINLSVEISVKNRSQWPQGLNVSSLFLSWVCLYTSVMRSAFR